MMRYMKGTLKPKQLKNAYLDVQSRDISEFPK